MEHILSMIGLAKKAGRVEIGEEPVGSAARSRHARVILVASDAAASSVRRAYAFAQTGACLCLTIPADKDALGRALGRSSCAMAAITDVGFADAIVKKLAEKYGQTFIDLQAAWDELFTHMHPANIAWDRIHPNHVGCVYIANQILKATGFQGL